jgi:hypothetical protein
VPCKPGEKRCATDGAAKVCDADGSAWVVKVCDTGDVCKDGACVLDVMGADCTPGSGRCVGTKTRLRCAADGHGFESTDCPDGAPCQEGECAGPVCNVGSTSCSQSNALRTCVDGKHFTETPCSANGTCQSMIKGGVTQSECAATPNCGFNGQRVCGDPTDASVSATAVYSECATRPDGSVGWTRVDCVAPATCDPTNVACSSQCVPGEKRCSGGVAFQQCGTDGTWGAAQACNTGTTSGLACRAKLGGSIADTECVDEACAGLAQIPTVKGVEAGTPQPSSTPAEGLCDGDQIRRCSTDGKLQAAADCASGSCRIVSNAAIDGAHPGACSKACSPGETRCVADGQPLYVTCDASGTFGTAYQSCGSVCQTGTDVKQKRVALCGDACIPGSTRCSGDKVQTCADSGKWGSAAACTVGICTDSDGQAICHAACVPDETLCVGASKDASDGVSTGTTRSVVCAANGTIPATGTACTGTQTCRTSQSGVVAGCVECMGPSVRGGNDTGIVDSRCSTDGKGVEVCGADNAWQASTSCGTGTCFVGRARSCGDCPNFGISGTCTESFIDQRFGTSNGCQQFGFGNTTACGSTPDCCGNACVASSGAFAFCAPKGFSACLGNSTATDLGATLPQTVTGSTLFSDDTLSPNCGTGRATPDDAYVFTAPKTGTYVFDTFGSKTDTVLYAIDAVACGELACSDDAQGTASRIFVALVAGQRAVVLVEGTGDYTLHVAQQGVPGCGNGIVENKEACDGNDFNGQSCASATFGSRPGGKLKCVNCALDVSGCTGGPDGGFGTGGGPGFPPPPPPSEGGI